MIQISLKKVPLPRAVILNIPVTKIRLHAKQPFQFSIVSEHCKKMASSQRTISDLDLISFFPLHLSWLHKYVCTARAI